MNENDRKEAVTGTVGETQPGETCGNGPDDLPCPKPGDSGWFSGLLINLRIAVRLVFFQRVIPSEVAATPGAFTVLAFADFFLHLALSFARVGPEGYFSPQSFPYAIAHIPLILLIGFLIGRLAHRDEAALAISTALLAAAIPIGMLAELSNAISENGWLGNVKFIPDFDHFYPFFGWWGLATLVAVIRMSGIRRSGWFGAIAIFCVTLLLPLWNIRRGELWNENRDSPVSDHLMETAGEEAIYRQPVLLKKAMEGLRPGRKGDGALYFVGFAGYGGQDVFRRELEVINGIMKERFDTSGHSLLLVNNPDTLLQYPLATATALGRVLKRVGRVMNRDEDILLLYLTSHGSGDSHLSAELQPMTFHDIYPAMLRRMLDESGIRWRIVVVSACYSGAYIDSLKNDDTLVMTASDASSSSFGCSNDSDFTWFGEALFDKELRRTHSFVTAFNRASAAIAAREKKEGEEASHPLLFVGKGIAPRLKRLEEKLEKKRL